MPGNGGVLSRIVVVVDPVLANHVFTVSVDAPLLPYFSVDP
jgi:hypothetical protein